MYEQYTTVAWKSRVPRPHFNVWQNEVSSSAHRSCAVRWRCMYVMVCGWIWMWYLILLYALLSKDNAWAGLGARLTMLVTSGSAAPTLTIQPPVIFPPICSYHQVEQTLSRKMKAAAGWRLNKCVQHYFDCQVSSCRRLRLPAATCFDWVISFNITLKTLSVD